MANDEVDRRSAILNAAVECFGTLGYYARRCSASPPW